MFTPKGLTTLKMVKTTFPITPQMGLTKEQLQVCAYVFHPERNPSEVIFKIDHTMGNRNDFQCLCPGRVVDQHIIQFIAAKVTWCQQQMDHKSIWSLPPSFANDLAARRTVDELVNSYADMWMPPFEDLKYIYIPIEEMGGSWYLMIVSIEEKLVYHIDPYYEPQNLVHRHDRIRMLGEVITQMTMSTTFPQDFLDGVLDIGNWEISEMGLFSPCYSNYSSIWVMHWMDMDWTFNPSQLQVVDHDLIRATVALGLLLSEHNEFKELLELNADLMWNTSSSSSAR